MNKDMEGTSTVTLSV